MFGLITLILLLIGVVITSLIALFNGKWGFPLFLTILLAIRIIFVLDTLSHRPTNKNEFIYQYNIISSSINQGDCDTYILVKASEINAVILKERELVEDYSDSWLIDKDIAELKLIKLTSEKYETK